MFRAKSRRSAAARNGQSPAMSMPLSTATHSRLGILAWIRIPVVWRVVDLDPSLGRKLNTSQGFRLEIPSKLKYGRLCVPRQAPFGSFALLANGSKPVRYPGFPAHARKIFAAHSQVTLKTRSVC